MVVLFRSFIALVFACIALQAAAQTYPAKPVHVIVPFPPLLWPMTRLVATFTVPLLDVSKIPVPEPPTIVSEP